MSDRVANSNALASADEIEEKTNCRSGPSFGFVIASQRQVLCFLATVLASVKALIEIGVLA